MDGVDDIQLHNSSTIDGKIDDTETHVDGERSATLPAIALSELAIAQPDLAISSIIVQHDLTIQPVTEVTPSVAETGFFRKTYL